jgi:ATP adenylyltransferase
MEERPLWAPWRIEYITGPKAGECIFCAAATGSVDGDSGNVVDRGDECFTMLNAFPYASGHVMVAPYRHVGELEALADRELLEIMAMARRAVAALRDIMSPDGFNAGFNLGEVAGAGYADHLHLHVVPRWRGDTNFMPVIGGTRVMSQALHETRELLVAALGREP